MSSPTPSNISQNDAKVLKKQQQEMQQRYEEEQWLLVQLEEVAKLHRAECAAQKARREAEEKAQEEAEKQRVAEEDERKRRTMEYLQQLRDEVLEERKRRTMEYLQQLRDKVLEEEATLLEGAEGSQVTGSKHKEIATRDEEVQWPSKKARGKQPGKYRGGAAVKMGVLTPARGV